MSELSDANNFRLFIIKKYVQKEISLLSAASHLHLSTSSIYRLAKNLREKGSKGLLPKKRGKPHNYIKEPIRSIIQSIYDTEPYNMCNFQFFSELVNEGISFNNETFKMKISKSTVSSILKEKGFQSPRKHRPKKSKKQRRPQTRAKHTGEKILLDGSPFDWFSIGKRCTMHGMLDDATGAFTSLRIEPNECFFGYAECAKETFKNYGIPEKFITDGASIFFTSRKLKHDLTIEEQLAGIPLKETQFSYTMNHKFGIEMVRTFEPEEKGRIERAWQTLQGRLPILFKLHGIKTIDEANEYLKSYIKAYNKQFSVEPESKKSSFIKLTQSDEELNHLLAIKHTRKTDTEGVFSFHNYKFLVDAPRKIDIAHKKIQLHISPALNGIQVKLNEKFYPAKLLDMDANKKMLKQGSTSLSLVMQDLFNKYVYLDAKKISRYHLASSA